MREPVENTLTLYPFGSVTRKGLGRGEISCNRSASSQIISWYVNSSLLNSTAGLSTSWTNRPFSLTADSTYGLLYFTPILLSGNDGAKYHFCGFYCNDQSAECLLGIFFTIPDTSSSERKLMDSQLVWSANRDNPVKANATLQLRQDCLKLTDTGNLVLFDKVNRSIWQSFDHPTECLAPWAEFGVWKEARSQRFIRQFESSSPDSIYLSFDGQTLTALQEPLTSPAQF
ncbi:hypothetical protein T459_20303 [Capsicum annuum]|uniref:Bulb-type lectin domain-containing protein n=1 Tax=Capsicum annuum TaxID=4072 RepID=A0A2G2Z4E0_CAPAN|nr:hypothetical protein T459_20303 [Capsicum annuum]